MRKPHATPRAVLDTFGDLFKCAQHPTARLRDLVVAPCLFYSMDPAPSDDVLGNRTSPIEIVGRDFRIEFFKRTRVFCDE